MAKLYGFRERQKRWGRGSRYLLAGLLAVLFLSALQWEALYSQDINAKLNKKNNFFPPEPYQSYRNTTLGNSLQDSLDELV